MHEMNTLMTERVSAALQEYTFETLSASVGLVAIVLLLVLLCVKELMRASAPERFQQWAEALDVAIAPLLLAFASILLARIVYYVVIAPLS
jgi:hypothetical protein